MVGLTLGSSSKHSACQGAMGTPGSQGLVSPFQEVGAQLDGLRKSAEVLVAAAGFEPEPWPEALKASSRLLLFGPSAPK